MILGDQQLKPAKPNTANRHIGDLRHLYEDCFTHIGDEERLNPFRKMFFKDDVDLEKKLAECERFSDLARPQWRSQ